MTRPRRHGRTLLDLTSAAAAAPRRLEWTAVVALGLSAAFVATPWPRR
jgi:hypothetical protein